MPKPARPALKQKRKVTLKRQLIFLYSCCTTLILLLVVGFHLDRFVTSQRVLGTQTQKEINQRQLLTQQRVYWEEFLGENPTYLDGWIELANINIELGAPDEARLSLRKAKEVNPNSPQVKDLEEKLNY